MLRTIYRKPHVKKNFGSRDMGQKGPKGRGHICDTYVILQIKTCHKCNSFVSLLAYLHIIESMQHIIKVITQEISC